MKISVAAMVEQKILKLHKYKIYDYSILSDIPNKEAVAIAISRLAKEGKIQKIGRGKFYKVDPKSNSVHGAVVGIDKNPIRRGSVRSKDIRLRIDPFWSNPGGKIPIDVFVRKVIAMQNPSDISNIKYRFGSNYVKQVYLGSYKHGQYPVAEALLGI